MIFDGDEDPEYIRDSIMPIPAAEVEFANELLQQRNALMRDHSKAQLVAMIRSRWAIPIADLVRSTKQELANDLVDGEDSRERHEAYGRVALINGRPVRDSRPLCGGVGCSGHDSAAWRCPGRKPARVSVPKSPASSPSSFHWNVG